MKVSGLVKYRGVSRELARCNTWLLICRVSVQTPGVSRTNETFRAAEGASVGRTMAADLEVPAAAVAADGVAVAVHREAANQEEAKEVEEARVGRNNVLRLLMASPRRRPGSRFGRLPRGWKAGSRPSPG
jgi:hypothetical protein